MSHLQRRHRQQHHSAPSDYPIRYNCEYKEPRNRWTTAFRLSLALPVLFALIGLEYAVPIFLFIAWLAILFVGRYPGVGSPRRSGAPLAPQR